MSYILATTETRVRWYQEFVADESVGENFVLHEVLDLRLVSIWGDKASAKLSAQRMRLKTWRYVQL